VGPASWTLSRFSACFQGPPSRALLTWLKPDVIQQGVFLLGPCQRALQHEYQHWLRDGLLGAHTSKENLTYEARGFRAAVRRLRIQILDRERQSWSGVAAAVASRLGRGLLQ